MNDASRFRPRVSHADFFKYIVIRIFLFEASFRSVVRA